MKKETGLANILVLVIAAVFIAMSAVMIFVDGVEIVFLCYGACTAAVVVGIYMIVRYFMTDAYKNMNAYGFSVGTFLIILGICGFLKAETMAQAFIGILGVILLLSGIIVLQHSLDLHRMKDGVWVAALIISLIILVCSMIVILQPMADKLGYDAYVWWMILVASSLSFLINIYTMIRVAIFKKNELKQENTDKDKTSEEDTSGVESENISNTSDDAEAKPQSQNDNETESSDKEHYDANI